MNAANIVLGSATLVVGGNDVGFTLGGIEVKMPREYKDIKADQAIGTIKKPKVNEAFHVKTTLLEGTLENLALAWDHASVSVIGGNTSASNEYVVVIVGPGPQGKTRTITLSRCIFTSEGTVKFSKDAESGIEIEIEAIKEDGSGATTLGKFGTVVDSNGNLLITTAATLPNGATGVAYSQLLAATGGTVGAGYAWSLVGGSLPSSVTIGASTGLLSGTHTGTGVFNFTIRVTDNASPTPATYDRVFTLTYV